MNSCFKKSLLLFVILGISVSTVWAYEMRYPFRNTKKEDKIVQCFENFGAYRKYSKSAQGFHKGIDLSTTSGTKIYPVAKGVIKYAGYNKKGYGYTVIIEHAAADGSKWQSHYSHMRGPAEFEKIEKRRKLTTEEAQLKAYIVSLEAKAEKKGYVDVDDWIGLEWDTGYSTGHHLHLGVGTPSVFDNLNENGKPDSNNLLNPITAGLKQPNHSGGLTVTNQPNAYLKDVYYVDPDGKKGIEWKYLDWMPGDKVRIVAEAYDKVSEMEV